MGWKAVPGFPLLLTHALKCLIRIVAPHSHAHPCSFHDESKLAGTSTTHYQSISSTQPQCRSLSLSITLPLSSGKKHNTPSQHFHIQITIRKSTNHRTTTLMSCPDCKLRPPLGHQRQESHTPTHHSPIPDSPAYEEATPSSPVLFSIQHAAQTETPGSPQYDKLIDPIPGLMITIPESSPVDSHLQGEH
ncbi:hypothetical protein KC19_6G050900 [Ceratodon purpureus]|uniref:Uncharacterized protein n=1 Tax=Ceratodon purpureus TaxID=3225 RepID=A0A8T0HEP0_CERPU|nr:hypothetical protein KC19_6G050900 [Ceratodon purpureus]